MYAADAAGTPKTRGYMRESEKRIKSILANSASAPNEEEYKRALATIEEATKEMTKALIAGDNDAFMLAREKQISAGGIIELYKARVTSNE